MLLFLAACNSDVPAPASVEFPADQVRLTITRVATNPFLSRHDLRLALVGPGGCSIEDDLFPNTGYVSRRNLYRTRAGLLYVVGQFDARVIDARTGEVLVPLTHIDAEFPALAGEKMKAARAAGKTQKSMITAHVANTVAGWLGIGPDNRTTFNRQGN